MYIPGTDSFLMISLHQGMQTRIVLGEHTLKAKQHIKNMLVCFVTQIFEIHINQRIYFASLQAYSGGYRLISWTQDHLKNVPPA